jgi:hypothetical protein
LGGDVNWEVWHGGRKWVTRIMLLKDGLVPAISLSLSLFPPHPRQSSLNEKLSSTIPFHHDVLPHYRSRNVEPSDYGLKSLKL